MKIYSENNFLIKNTAIKMTRHKTSSERKQIVCARACVRARGVVCVGVVCVGVVCVGVVCVGVCGCVVALLIMASGWTVAIPTKTKIEQLPQIPH